ncbi:hypothetical protein [Sphingomonas montanisoli]|uniref:PAS domain-containing protein n=1 Tax=Sphingomonas montanisoli TaxID=2606412 RepID=A0A5D9CE40_9SPHN|nr:hypothetical protein [Sphingomonas montanisoli]TZG29462.1 hypothetical protein FYJ91_04900 [Sphingomonas montanisoli]
MEDYRSWGAGSAEWDFPVADEPCMDMPPMIGTDERRMHVRAYEHWVSLLDGRSYPAITDLDAAMLGEFGPYSTLLDFSISPRNPAITFLGRALREEGDLDGDLETIGDVPAGSLLSRLTDHYDEVLRNRAPVGFEAEFTNNRGEPTLYRGILMPYSSSGDTIDFVHGVINWKLAEETDLPADVVAAVTTAFAGPAQPLPEPEEGAIDWADFDAEEDETEVRIEALVQTARDHAAAAREGEERGRASLYRAIGLAYDIALAGDADPETITALIDGAGIAAQARAPMTPIVKLVFGADYDAKRVTEYAAVLTHARRLCLGAGMVEAWLSQFDGGIKGVVTAERLERRPALKTDKAGLVRQRLRDAAPVATVSIDAAGGDFVLLVARREGNGTLAVMAPAPASDALVDRVLRSIEG